MTRLKRRPWIVWDDDTIADMAPIGWVGVDEAGDLVDSVSLEAVPAWLGRVLARPAVKRGLEIPRRP